MEYLCRIDKAYKPSPRIFFGSDGHPYITDKFGVRRATALALVLLAPKPTRRAACFREAGNE